LRVYGQEGFDADCEQGGRMGNKKKHYTWSRYLLKQPQVWLNIVTLKETGTGTKDLVQGGSSVFPYMLCLLDCDCKQQRNGISSREDGGDVLASYVSNTLRQRGLASNTRNQRGLELRFQNRSTLICRL
jgi:hypothetical protein